VSDLSHCRTCGKRIPYDRWDDDAMNGFCSGPCRAHHAVMSRRKRKGRNGGRRASNRPCRGGI